MQTANVVYLQRKIQLSVFSAYTDVPLSQLIWVNEFVMCYKSYSSTVHFHRITSIYQHIPTQHDMLPQHLVCKYELNCEYCNITLARNKAP